MTTEQEFEFDGMLGELELTFPYLATCNTESLHAVMKAAYNAAVRKCAETATTHDGSNSNVSDESILKNLIP